MLVCQKPPAPSRLSSPAPSTQHRAAPFAPAPQRHGILPTQSHSPGAPKFFLSGCDSSTPSNSSPSLTSYTFRTLFTHPYASQRYPSESPAVCHRVERFAAPLTRDKRLPSPSVFILFGTCETAATTNLLVSSRSSLSPAPDRRSSFVQARVEAGFLLALGRQGACREGRRSWWSPPFRSVRLGRSSVQTTTPPLGV